MITITQQNLRAIGTEISRLTGAPSKWFFGTYSCQGRLVACPKGQPEVVVALRKTIWVSDSNGPDDKYVAWGIPATSESIVFWEATPEGVEALAAFKARVARITVARDKAAVMRKARHARELAAWQVEKEEAKAARRRTRQQPQPDRPAFQNNPFAGLEVGL